MATADPFAAFVPAVGLVLITLPEGVVDDDCDVVVTVKPAWPSWFDAVDAVSPTTFGIDTSPAPLDTVIVTTEFFVAFPFALGD